MRQPAWGSWTWQCVGHRREELPVEAILRAFGYMGFLCLPPLLVLGTGLKTGRVVHGGSRKVVEPERAHKLLSMEERGGAS